MIKGCPCKIVDYSTSKTGKHGHAKANIVAVDIFTGKKLEDISPTSHNMQAPVVTRKDYQLLDVEDDGHISVLDEHNKEVPGFKLDLENDDLHKKIKDDFEEGKDLAVTVLSAMGNNKIIASKELS